MSRLRSIFLHGAAFLVLPVLVAAWGIHRYRAREHPALLPPASGAVVSAAAPPPFDPARPTVVVVLGADITEITDALGPYEMFARVGAYNVVTAASDRRPTSLTGGLAVLPHYSLAAIDRLLAGRAPAIVVVPNIPNIAEPIHVPLVSWLREQAARGSLMHSWCKGAMALAEAGLLDGREATAHWGDLPQLERLYPRVRWRRGVRWIEHGQFVISAGITSGIDASLRVITRLNGEQVARRVAQEMHYPNFHFAVDPRVAQYEIRPADAVLLANAAFGQLGRERIGLALYPGVGELYLSNIYDAHAYTMTANVEAVSEREDIVRSAHGLTLLPAIVASRDRERVRHLDRLVVPGSDGAERASSLVAAAEAAAPSLPVAYLHADEPERFGLESVLEDLARTSDIATATFALRRMEYRSSEIAMRGSGLRWSTVGLPLLLGGLGVLALRVLRGGARRWRYLP